MRIFRVLEELKSAGGVESWALKERPNFLPSLVFFCEVSIVERLTSLVRRRISPRSRNFRAVGAAFDSVPP
jgi:hypothetical protein